MQCNEEYNVSQGVSESERERERERRVLGH